MWFKKQTPAPVAPSEEVVRRYALRHLAELFDVSESELFLDARFGQELKANSRSFFKPNQLDILDDEIKDVADKRLLHDMASGRLVIQTVGDYCQHMIR